MPEGYEPPTAPTEEVHEHPPQHEPSEESATDSRDEHEPPSHQSSHETSDYTQEILDVLKDRPNRTCTEKGLADLVLRSPASDKLRGRARDDAKRRIHQALQKLTQVPQSKAKFCPYQARNRSKSGQSFHYISVTLSCLGNRIPSLFSSIACSFVGCVTHLRRMIFPLRVVITTSTILISRSSSSI